MLKASSVKAIHMLVTEPVVFAFGLWIAFCWAVVFLFLSVIPITFQEHHGWGEGVSGLPYISLCIGTTLGWLEGSQHILGVVSNRAQQGLGGAGGLAPALLPIPQRADFDAEQCCEIGLAQTRLGTQCLDAGRRNFESTRRPTPTRDNLASVVHALQKFVEFGFLHFNAFAASASCQ
jgi:hypothetical protein